LRGMKVEPVLAPEADIQRVIRQHYGVGGEVVQEMMTDSDVVLLDDSLDENGDVIDEAQEATVVKLVNDIVTEAIRDKASDIHIEPYEHDLEIRYRIDGVLHQTATPPQMQRFQAAIISRIKIMADLNIAEKRLPQDGAFKMRVQGREVDFRVSIIPTSTGEAVVIRILDKQSVLIGMDRLGFEDSTREVFESLITRPHGIILVTGPTGSGKTTTLYASLNRIIDGKIKILTIEDPVEYRLGGIQQVQIRPSIGLTFSTGLRSFLRHDPDVILVGEIRDKETAEVAINASLTGHLVLSTLHTNDAVTANTRLLDMGVEPFLIASSVEGILAQRLVRTVCQYCKEEYDPDPEQLPADFEYQPGERLFRGTGCRECRNSGYSGRLGVYEFLVMNEELRELIVQRASGSQMLRCARENGLVTLRDDGWKKVRRGLTTPEEVLRVARV